MKKKAVITICTLLIALSILTILGIRFVKKVKEDQKITEENIKIIEKSYNNITEKVIDYNQSRNEIAEFINNFYYDTIEKKYNDNLEALIKYDSVVKKITKEVQILDEKCNMIYTDTNINNICNNYKKEYEIIINLYVNDVNNYNTKINSYNQANKKELELFKIDYEYVDYNNDQIYEMKDEVNG